MINSDEHSSVAVKEVSHGTQEYANEPSFEIAWAVKVSFRFRSLLWFIEI